ncbi:MAG: peptidylprolyl isomerase, partial [Beijerinckiaceae bacterium]
AQEEVRTIYNKIEDQRTSGKVLEEAAKSIGQKVRVIEAIDANGRDKKGEPVGDIVEQKQLLQSAFASDIGVDNETLTIPSGGYLWFEVAAIDEARDRKLDEVKESVETAWRNAEISNRLREKGEALVKEIEGGKAIAEVAKGAGLQIQNAPDVKRTSHPKLAPAVVNRIFSLPVGSTGTAPGNAGDRVVFKIVDASTPPLVDKSEELERIEKQLESAYQQELTEEYVAQLRRGVTITYNPAAIRNVVGGEEN